MLKSRVQGKFQHYLFISLFFFLFGCVFTADENVPVTGCLDGNCKDGFGREVKKISGLIFLNVSTAVYEEYSGSFKDKKEMEKALLKNLLLNLMLQPVVGMLLQAVVSTGVFTTKEKPVFLLEILLMVKKMDLEK